MAVTAIVALIYSPPARQLFSSRTDKDPATIIRVTAQLLPKELQVFQRMLERMDERDKAERVARGETVGE
jgi:hypothetical protein